MVILDFFIACSLAAFCFVMGVITGSAGLHAMALQELADIIGKGVNWLSIVAAKKPPSIRFPYGYGKLQFLSALVMGGLLSFGAAFFIFYNISHINSSMVEPPSQAAIIAAILVGITGEITYRIMDCVGEKNNNMAILAAAMDNRLDALSSLMVLVGAVLSNLGWFAADHVAALAVAVLVVRVGATIMTEAIQGLLDIGPKEEIMALVKSTCLNVDEIKAIKNLRGRRLGDSYEFDVSLFVSGSMTVYETAELKKLVSNKIYEAVRHTEHIHISLYPFVRQ
ncbi:MAG: cation diffusion facilitator family transporter [Magnetococcales bacterium]|nr:cation diffusion facilitator family transporter [Magnetococcales bacterium]